jgi:hypothetical protein
MRSFLLSLGISFSFPLFFSLLPLFLFFSSLSSSFPLPLFLFRFPWLLSSLSQLWDTAGDDMYHDMMITSFFKRSSACILVYDITNKASLENLRKKYLNFADVVKEEEEKVSYFVIGNKLDLAAENRQVIFLHRHHPLISAPLG